MPAVEFLPISADHIAFLGKHMRAADKAEVVALGFADAETGLAYAVEKSAFSTCALVDGVPAVAFGVVDLNILTRTGAPWLLGTHAVNRNPRLFLRETVRWREQLTGRYDTLRNAVDDRYEASKRWLSWLGFDLSEPIPFGTKGELFRVFEMRR